MSNGGSEQDATVLEPQLVAMFGDIDQEAHHFARTADPNSDGNAEIIVHVACPTNCGTGGYDALVFTPDGPNYRLVSDIAPGRSPIQLCSREANGWRNLLVHVGGGGMEATRDAEVEFGGTVYTENPTDPSVAPWAHRRGLRQAHAPRPPTLPASAIRSRHDGCR